MHVSESGTTVGRAQSPSSCPVQRDSSGPGQAADSRGGPGKGNNAKRPEPIAAVMQALTEIALWSSRDLK